MAKRIDHVTAATGEMLLKYELHMPLHSKMYRRLQSRYGLTKSEVRKAVNHLVDAGRAEVRPHKETGFKGVAVFPKETAKKEESHE